MHCVRDYSGYYTVRNCLINVNLISHAEHPTVLNVARFMPATTHTTVISHSYRHKTCELLSHKRINGRARLKIELTLIINGTNDFSRKRISVHHPAIVRKNYIHFFNYKTALYYCT